MAQRVDLHVGTPKSGTTFLQSTLWANREQLLERGVLYPGRKAFDQKRASMQVRAGAHIDVGRAAPVWRSFCRQAAAHDGQVVLSNEWWLAANRRQAEAAVEQIGGGPGNDPDGIVHVVITTRSPVLAVPAAWQESLKVGRGHSLTDFVAALDGDGKWTWDVLDPAAVAQRWAAIVGPERVHVVTTPPTGGAPDLLWRRFAETIGFSPEGTALPRPANESLSVQGARLLQEYGPALLAEIERTDDPGNGPARWLRNTLVRQVLVGVPGEPIGVGPELRDRLLERGADAARRLRELGVQVTGDLDDITTGDDRPGARHPDSVTDAELVTAGRTLAVGQLRLQMAPGAEQEPEQEPAPAARRRRIRSAGERTRRWTFLVPSAYATGGIARTTSITANTLVERGHEVRVITLSRSSEQPAFAFDPRVRLVPLYDRFDPENPSRPRPVPRKDPQAKRRIRKLDEQPSRLVADEQARQSFTAFVDKRLEEELSALPPGVVVSTRPEFGVAAALWTHPDSILVHQEHLSFLPRPEPLRAALRRVATGAGGVRSLDALLTLTEADLERWREYVDDPSLRMGAIPNPTPFTGGEPAPLTNPVVIAAGRLSLQKGFERLVEAWVPLATSHPDWQLRIYGDGPQHSVLAQAVAEAGVGDRILLAGVTREFEQELAGASIYAMSSRYEGLPMVLLEALSKGVPPVSFDCPEGPRQLIRSGTNGLLVRQGDIDGLTDALRSLMDDPARRRELGAAGLETARDFEPGAVVDRWVELVEDIDADRS
ncbi:glycosyltransferase family 4 protein [Nocardioides pyridinolyticus]